MDPRWSLPSRLADNPMVWTLTLNGVIVDVRMMSREIQEEAHRLGLIPLHPGPTAVHARMKTSKTRATDKTDPST